MDNGKCVLMYGFSKEDIENFRGEFEDAELIEIKDEMTSMKVKDIIEGIRFQIYVENLPKDKVILFNGFSDSEVQKHVKSIRGMNFLNEKPILAVVTSTSAEWTFKYLLDHLIEERKLFLKPNGTY